jgi:hypothetical protein
MSPELGRLLEKAALGAEAGVGEDGVEAPERLDCRGREGLVVGPLRHVAAHGDGLLGPAELVCELGELLLATCRKHQAVALLGSLASRRGADPARGAGDHEHGFVGHGGNLANAVRHNR